jgi:hypothetical protein
MLCIGLAGCSTSEKHDKKLSGATMATDQRIGTIKYDEIDKLDKLIKRLGAPDYIESASNYGARFEDGIPSVVLTYQSLGLHFYVTRDCIVLGSGKIKEKE